MIELFIPPLSVGREKIIAIEKINDHYKYFWNYYNFPNHLNYYDESKDTYDNIINYYENNKWIKILQYE